MTFSGIFHSVWSSTSRKTENAPVPSDSEQSVLHRCDVYRKSFPMTDIAIPAYELRQRAVAKWVRDQRLAVDVRTGEDIAVAIAAGIHVAHLIVHAEEMTESDLRATVNLSPGLVVVSTMSHIDLVAAAVEHRTQNVFVHVIDGNAPALVLSDGRYAFHGGFRLDSTELDRAVSLLFNCSRLDLIGLHCDVGTYEHDYVSYPAAIGAVITEMDHIRRQHGLVLMRLGLGGGVLAPSDDWATEVPELASQIDESLDDACATMRFPRPIVVLSPGRAITERYAA